MRLNRIFARVPLGLFILQRLDFLWRSYRNLSPECIVDDLASIREDGIFIVDDVAFIQERQAFAIGEAIARKNIHKKYYLETRGDVLL